MKRDRRTGIRRPGRHPAPTAPVAIGTPRLPVQRRWSIDFPGGVVALGVSRPDSQPALAAERSDHFWSSGTSKVHPPSNNTPYSNC